MSRLYRFAEAFGYESFQLWTIAQQIQGQQKGLIQQLGGKALSIEELRRASINAAVLGAVDICSRKVPAEVMRKVQAAIKRSGSK